MPHNWSTLSNVVDNNNSFPAMIHRPTTSPKHIDNPPFANTCTKHTSLSVPHPTSMLLQGNLQIMQPVGMHPPNLVHVNSPQLQPTLPQQIRGVPLPPPPMRSHQRMSLPLMVFPGQHRLQQFVSVSCTAQPYNGTTLQHTITHPGFQISQSLAFPAPPHCSPPVPPQLKLKRPTCNKTPIVMTLNSQAFKELAQVYLGEATKTEETEPFASSTTPIVKEETSALGKRKSRSAYHSKYRGVCRTNANGSTWVATVYFGSRGRCRCGTFATEEEAARAYDAKARLIHGKKAKLNFPDEDATTSQTHTFHETTTAHPVNTMLVDIKLVPCTCQCTDCYPMFESSVTIKGQRHVLCQGVAQDMVQATTQELVKALEASQTPHVEDQTPHKKQRHCGE